MAYLHCHTKDCGWSQDDFWDKKYNPATKLWRSIKWLWKPRWIGFDKDFPSSRKHITPLWVKNKKEEIAIFSWNLLLIEIEREIKCVWNQKWWTWKGWSKDKKNAVCPRCGEGDFDID